MKAAPTVLFCVPGPKYGGRMIVVHAGNRIDGATRPTARFPVERIDIVADMASRLLRSLGPRLVVSAPAAGADLIVLAAAQDLGIDTEVVLPIDPEGFVAASVADNGVQWVRRFRTVLTKPNARTRQLHLDPDTAWWFEANAALLAAAQERAADNEPVIALTVRPIGGEFPPSVTDDFAERAHAIGLLVLTIDPRPQAAPAEVVISPNVVH
jgi:hypothetical protein